MGSYSLLWTDLPLIKINKNIFYFKKTLLRYVHNSNFNNLDINVYSINRIYNSNYWIKTWKYIYFPWKVLIKLRLILPMAIQCFSLFGFIFEIYLNIFAEITYFADR